MATKFHVLLCNELQRIYEAVKSGQDERDIFEVQPQIGKSRAVSELFAAWVLGKEAWPIIVASYGADLAETKSAHCRSIVASEAYQLIFPDTKLNPETAAKGLWETTTGGSYRAVGVGGALTGMSGKILICDDPFKDRADADSVTVRDATHKWWESVFMTRKQNKSAVILVNTRWHLDDVSGHVQSKQRMNERLNKDKAHYDQWNLFSFPAFAEKDEWIHGKFFRKTGDVLCPERFSFDAMKKTQNDTDLYEWSALYMQTPILKENAKFKDFWFKYYEPADIKFKKLSYVTISDPASSKKKGADNVVVRTIGKELSTGYIFLMREDAGHFDPGTHVDLFFLHVKAYPGTKVWIEAQAYQSTLEYWVIEKQKKEQIFFEVNLLTQKQSKSKEDRIEGLIPLYKAGMIFHQQSDKDYELELLQFPQGKHDDRIDTVAMLQNVVQPTMQTETAEQKKIRIMEERQSFDRHKAFSSM